MTENNETPAIDLNPSDKITVNLGVSEIVALSDTVALALMDDNTVRWYDMLLGEACTAESSEEDTDA